MSQTSRGPLNFAQFSPDAAQMQDDAASESGESQLSQVSYASGITSLPSEYSRTSQRDVELSRTSHTSRMSQESRASNVSRMSQDSQQASQDSRASQDSQQASQREDVEDAARFPRMKSQQLANGKMMRYIIEGDAEEDDEITAERKRAALKRNLDLRDLDKEYRRLAMEIAKSADIDRHKRRNKRPETDGALWQQHCSVHVAQRHITVARTQLGLVKVVEAIEYHEVVRRLLAQDHDRDVLSTLLERPSLAITGVRLCVRLHYGSWVRLDEEASRQHILLAAQLAREVFTNLPANCYQVYVSRSSARLKYHTQDVKHMDVPMLRNSFQLVWPHMPPINEQKFFQLFWQALEMRIRKSDSFFANVVDMSILRPDGTIRLLAPYSYKTKRCTQCRPYPVSKNKRAWKNGDREPQDFESSQDEEDDPLYARKPANRHNIGVDVCDCTQGRRVTGTWCKLYTCVDADSAFDDEVVKTVERRDELHYLSIVPGRRSEPNFMMRFEPAPEAPDFSEFAHSNEKSKPPKEKLTSTEEIVNRQEKPDVYQLCTDVIRLVGGGVYEQLTAERVKLQKAKQSIFVNVWGPNQRFCFLHGGQHAERNPIYFIIRPAYFQVSVYCYSNDCKNAIKARSELRQTLRAQAPKKKRKKNEADLDVDHLLPEEEAKAFRKMEAYIGSATKLREKLFDVLDMEYTGKKREVARLCADNASPLEEKVFDSQFCLHLPRDVAFQSREVKMAYLNSLDTPEVEKLITGPQTIAFVKPTPNSIGTTPYLNPPDMTKDERLAKWMALRARIT